jgi:hypothetical protein
MEDIPEEVYRVKYLKYKKKYLELSQSAGSNIALGTKQEQIDAKKSELKEQYTTELVASQEKMGDLYSGASEDQQLKIREVLSNLFGSEGLEGINEIQGQFVQAIDAIVSERTDLVRVLSNVLYEDPDTGLKSKLDDNILKNAVTEVFTIDKISTKIINAYIKDFSDKLWKEYKHKKGMSPEEEKIFSNGDNQSLRKINKQNILDAECEDLGLHKGPAACRDENPNTMGEETQPGRGFRETQFKNDFNSIDAELDENKKLIQGIQNRVVAAQNKYNVSKNALAEAHKEWLGLLNKEAKDLKADHASDDTLNAWTKNKPAVEEFLNSKSCKQQSIQVKGECNYKNIINTLKERHTNITYDENTDSFQKSVGKGNIKLK